MSLTRFLRLQDVIAKLKPLRPKHTRIITASLKVAPRSPRPPLIGTAFDYLLRFEVGRRNPHAESWPWVAEYAPDIVWSTSPTGNGGIALRGVGHTRPPWELAEQLRSVVGEAKAAVAAYRGMAAPTHASISDLAAHALRLANLDDVYREHKLDPTFAEANSDEIEELVALLAVVPFDDLLTDAPVLLNPNFGEASRCVGGADADMIVGGLLVDIKTTKKTKIEDAYLDQLLGYFLLARRHRVVDPTFCGIDRAGVYFSRHGYLWAFDVSEWTMHPMFPDVEAWFFQRAGEVFKTGVG